MNKAILNFLRAAFPFILTLLLWRVSAAYLNPAGMLVLVPIFYCTFIAPVPWFAPFALIMCFVLDYKADTILYWTSIFCLCYAVNGFQNIVDLKRMENNGWGAFALFCMITITIMSISHWTNFTNVFRTFWTVCLECAMYIPIVMIIKKVRHD